MIAADLMDASAPALSPDDELPTAAALLSKYEHSLLPVVDDAGVLVGVVAERDLLSLALPAAGIAAGSLSYLPKCYGLRNLDSAALRQVKVRDIMQSTELVTVGPDEPAAEVALRMVRHNLPQLPVVSGGKLLGRICRKKVIGELVDPTLGVSCDPWA